MFHLPDIGLLQTNQTANAGTYICMNCSHIYENDKAVIILYKREKLPKCPACKNPTYWMVV